MSVSRLSRAVSASAVSVALVAGSLALAAQPASAAAPAVSIAVPAYFADQATWDKVIAIPEVTYVIGHPIAPVPGQPYSVDKELAGRLAEAKAKGKTTLLYITAGYDKVDWKVVADKIDLALKAYTGVDGVFIDEINYDQCDKYTSLLKGAAGTQGVRARQPNKQVVLNPGAPMLNCYEGLADGYVNLERADAKIAEWVANVNLPGNVGPYAWMFTPANRPKMWQMIHSVAGGNVASTLDAALARNASVVYLTDDIVNDITKDNPYDNLPSSAFLTALLARVQQYNSGAAALPAVKQLTAPTTTKAATTVSGSASGGAITIKTITKKTVNKTVKKTVKK